MKASEFITAFLKFHTDFEARTGVEVDFDQTVPLFLAGQPFEAEAIPVPAPVIEWSDSIQTSSNPPFGFNQIQLERPLGTSVSASNADVGFTRVTNPLGNGFAIRQHANFNPSGARSQAGIYSFANATFDRLVKSGNEIYIAQEWYFPKALAAGALNSNPWINLGDIHSVGSGSRWDTQPGLMLAEDGSMRVSLSWREINDDSPWSSLALPVGRWFDIEMRYRWATSGAVVSVWIDGQLALEQTGLVTRDPGHNTVEIYLKFYGSQQGGGAWPTDASKYIRNIRLSAQRIWR